MPVISSKTKNFRVENLLNTKSQEFQAILQLLQLVDALIAGPSKGNNFNDQNYRRTRKSFDYIDAITNLMVRNDEVMAAVSCESHPGHHIISVESPASETETPSTDMPPSSEFFEDSGGENLRVAAVANSKFYLEKDFAKVPDTTHFTLFSSSSENWKQWEELKNREAEDVNLWYDFDSLLVGVLFDARLGSTKR